MSKAGEYSFGDVILGRWVNIAVKVDIVQFAIVLDAGVVAFEQRIGQIILDERVLQPVDFRYEIKVVLGGQFTHGRHEVGDFRLQFAFDVHLQLRFGYKRVLIIFDKIVDEIFRLIGRYIPCVDDGLIDHRSMQFVEFALDKHVKLIFRVDQIVHSGRKFVLVAVRRQEIQLLNRSIDYVRAVHSQIDQHIARFERRYHKHFPIARTFNFKHRIFYFLTCQFHYLKKIFTHFCE